MLVFFFFFSSRRRHTRFDCDWSSDVCSSDLRWQCDAMEQHEPRRGHLRLRPRADGHREGARYDALDDPARPLPSSKGRRFVRFRRAQVHLRARLPLPLGCRDRTMTMDASRRQFLIRTLFGAGMLGLRSLATGIPMSILADPRRALAADSTTACPPNPAQYILFSSSGNGDPVNANVPGAYAMTRIRHPPDPPMAPTPLMLAGKQ